MLYIFEINQEVPNLDIPRATVRVACDTGEENARTAAIAKFCRELSADTPDKNDVVLVERDTRVFVAA